MKFISSIFLCLITSLTFAQEKEPTPTVESSTDEYEIKTICGSNASHGGYGAITTDYASIGNRESLLVGGRGAWVINHNFAIGLGGYGLANNVVYDDVYDESTQLELGYGGIYIEQTILSKWPIHLSFPILIGAGGAAYASPRNDYIYDSEEDWEGREIKDSDAFFVIQPGVNVEFNMTKVVRIAVGASYRHIEGLQLDNTSGDLLTGLSSGITVKVGKF